MARILVVDDEPPVLALLSEMLTTGGHQVVVANNVAHGLKLTQHQSPDLAILDIGMPEGQHAGLELLQRIKAYKSSIAVIMITGAASKQRVVAALRGGAQDFIEKPFSYHEVTKRVETALLHQKTAWAY